MLQYRLSKWRLQLISPSDEKKSLVDAVAILSSDDGLPVHLKTIIGHLLERATLADELIQRNRKLQEQLEADIAKTTVSGMRSFP
ncbi:unnamed protein product [Heligmosomoides polygyrus]|uniref:HisKA domain-containing protein n=1 Tax=Heligmosomoides polygyrus TaxID=6339 RepID=A0A183FUA1_HELPZ|nr:unnamed protein product [Heligmosomoides polygyrus]